MGLSLDHFIVCVHIASKESVYCIQYEDVYLWSISRTDHEFTLHCKLHVYILSAAICTVCLGSTYFFFTFESDQMTLIRLLFVMPGLSDLA